MKKNLQNIGNGYLKDDRHIYFHTWTEGGYEDKIVKDTDYSTFSVVKWEYARDKNNVYYYGKKIDGADVLTFKVIQESDDKEKATKDRNSVYWHGTKLKDADPVTFQLLKHGYKKDKNHVYYWRTLIKEADSDSFEILATLYSKDKNFVFYGEAIIKNADPQTFEHLNNLYSRDKNFVYSGASIIQNADKDTFQVLGKGTYAKDKNMAYFDCDPIKNVDVKTFKIIDEDNKFSKDRNNEYWQNKKINDDGTVDIDIYPSTEAKNPTHTEKMKVVQRNLATIIFKKLTKILK